MKKIIEPKMCSPNIKIWIKYYANNDICTKYNGLNYLFKKIYELPYSFCFIKSPYKTSFGQQKAFN